MLTKREMYKTAVVANGNFLYKNGECVAVEYDCHLDGENGGHFFAVSRLGRTTIIMRESDLSNFVL